MKLQGLSYKSIKCAAKILRGQENQLDELEILKNAIIEIRGHLGAAVAQSIPEDDQIIMGHVRDALEITKQVS